MLVTGLPQNWRVVLAALLGLVAPVLLVVNLRELRRWSASHGVQEASPRTSAMREIPVRRSSSPKA